PVARTRKPARSRESRTIFTILGSSSTTRIVLITPIRSHKGDGGGERLLRPVLTRSRGRLWTRGTGGAILQTVAAPLSPRARPKHIRARTAPAPGRTRGTRTGLATP